ncbi:MAG: cryptochrome/photolyase family protein [Rhodobacteraceae bacterium]|nr:cryptochrome/photolyase family protein [Paracoccaceae bacterium]
MLMDADKPADGKWNSDHDNRKPASGMHHACPHAVSTRCPHAGSDPLGRPGP